MNKKKAMMDCKELWAEIEASGLSKYRFLNAERDRKWLDKDYLGECPLCEYAGDDCAKCPLVTQYGKGCQELGYHGFTRSEPEFFEHVRGLK